MKVQYFIISFLALALCSEAYSYEKKKIIISVGVNKLKTVIESKSMGSTRDAKDLAWANRDARLILDHFKTIGYDGFYLQDSTSKELKKKLNYIKSLDFMPDDEIIIYISSHGLRRNTPKGIKKYVIFSDTDIHDLENTSITVDKLVSTLSNLGSKRKALIVAACKSGSYQQPIEGTKALSSYSTPQTTSFLVLSATNDDGIAFEDSRKGDIYTHYLLQSMKNSDELKSLSKAHTEASINTARTTNFQQLPTFGAVISGFDEIIVNSNDDSLNISTVVRYTENIVRKAAGLPLRKVLLDGQNITELEPGIYEHGGIKNLEVFEEGKLILSKSLKISTGKTHILDSYVATKPPLYRVALIGSIFSPATNAAYLNQSHYSGFGFNASYGDSNLRYVLKSVIYQSNEKVLIKDYDYKFSNRIIQTSGGIRYSYLIDSFYDYDLSATSSLYTSLTHISNKTPDKYFENNPSGMLPGAEVEIGLSLESDKYQFGFNLTSDYHIDASHNRHKSVGIQFTLGFLSW